MTNIEALNCPNCGAGVDSDSTQCGFCKTRLKTMACPACFGLMFIGSKFCGHCGAVAAPLEVSLSSEAGDCPRCHADLEKLSIGGTDMRGCAQCDGLWVNATTFADICAEREKQSSVLGYLNNRTVRGQPLTKVNYVPCPDCKQLMNRNNFARASGVIVDICKAHGVWFDADELPSIIEYIRHGGMAMAREREQQELRDARTGANETRIWISDEKAAIRDFISSIFS